MLCGTSLQIKRARWIVLIVCTFACLWLTGRPLAAQVCGDGVFEAGEECEDHNTDDGDGCSASCQIEPVCDDGDLDANRVVNLADFLKLVLGWLSTDCAAPDWCDNTDINRSGVVDADDISLFAQVWQEICPYDKAALLEPPCQQEPLASPCDCAVGCGSEGSLVNPTYGIQPHSGEFTHRVVDLRIRGRGLDFVWGRKYRSRTGHNTAMGNNWDFSYNIRVTQRDHDRIVADGNGRRDRYLLQPDGTWVKDGFFRVLNENPDGTHALTFADTGRWEFHALDHATAPGKIKAIVDRNGNTIKFEYDDQGRLATVFDPLHDMTRPREISIAYNSEGLIASVTDFTGRQVLYEYYQEGDSDGSAGDLKSVRSPVVVGTPTGNDFPDGKTTIYTFTNGTDGYYGDTLHGLTTITDAKGQVFLHNTYAPPPTDPLAYDFDRVIRQAIGDPNDAIDIVYVPLTPGVQNGQAVSKAWFDDMLGDVTSMVFSADNQCIEQRRYTGRADPDLPSNPDAGLNPPVNRLRPDDPNFFETRIAYNDDFLARQIIYPHLKETVNVYELQLDPNAPRRSRGNLMERRILAGASHIGPASNIVEQFEYDTGLGGCCGTNFVTRHIDGRGHETAYEYDLVGNRLRTTHRIPSIVEDFKYNNHGQLTRRIHPANDSGHRRVDVLTYYDDPNDPVTGHMFGYLHQQIIDHAHDDPNDPPGSTYHFALTTGYEYDPVGNVTRVTDPRGNDTQFVVNELNQVVRRLSREVTDGSGLRYENDIYYDRNNNVVRTDVQNIDETGTLQANTHFTTIHEYEMLNHRTRTSSEVGDYTGAIPGPTDQPASAGLPEEDFVTTEYEYDAKRNRVLVRSPEAVEGRQSGNVVRTIYDERDLVFQTILAPGDPNQSTTQYDYDVNGNATTITQGLEDVGNERVIENTYDGFDRHITRTDPMGNVVTSEYDDNHNVVSNRLEGELTDLPGSAGNVRLYQETILFDDMDRPTERSVAFFDPVTQLPISDGVSSDFNDWTHVWMYFRSTNDNGHALTVERDTANRVATVTDPAGNIQSYTYNANSRVIAVNETDKSDLGNPDQLFTTTIDYDNLDRPTITTDNVLNFNTFSYDSRGSRVFRVDARGNEVRFVFDGLNRLIKTVRDMNGDGADPNAMPDDAGPDIVTTQSYDDNSRVIGRTDDNGNTTGTGYDALNRSIGRVHADGTVYGHTYDVHHNRTTSIDANGNVVTCSYDLNNRLTNKTIAVGPGVANDTTFETFAYDGRNRLISGTDDDSTVLRAYDSLSNCTAETLNGQTTGTVYDGVGNLLTCAYPGGRTISRSYDELERVSSVTDTTGSPVGIADYSYLGADRIEQRDLGNGTRTEYTYGGQSGGPVWADSFGVKKPIRTTHSVIAGGAIIDDRTYRWDRTGNKTERADVRPGGPELNHAYHYDRILRLAQSVVTDVGGGPVDDTVYNCDGGNNRIQVTGGLFSGPYTRDSNLAGAADKQVNQYTTTPTDSREYDENGNPTLMDRGGGETSQLRYDYANRLVEVQANNAGGTLGTTSFVYDAFGRAIVKFGDAGEERYFYQGGRQIEEQDNTGTTQATYVIGSRESLSGQQNQGGIQFLDHFESCSDLKDYLSTVALSEPDKNYANETPDPILSMQRGGSNYGYHSDDLGNVMALTDNTGAVVCRYAYDDYGEPNFFDGGGNPLPGSAIDNPFLFQARRLHPEMGLYDTGRRFLEPGTGRYLTRHSAGDWIEGMDFADWAMAWSGNVNSAGNLGNAYTFNGNNPWSTGAAIEQPRFPAVVDTGYDYNHEDKAARRVYRTPGFTTGEGDVAYQQIPMGVLLTGSSAGAGGVRSQALYSPDFDTWVIVERAYRQVAGAFVFRGGFDNHSELLNSIMARGLPGTRTAIDTELTPIVPRIALANYGANDMGLGPAPLQAFDSATVAHEMGHNFFGTIAHEMGHNFDMEVQAARRAGDYMGLPYDWGGYMTLVGHTLGSQHTPSLNYTGAGDYLTPHETAVVN
jgi:cysteine-rich repeat protein/YD repeat-containing protein